MSDLNELNGLPADTPQDTPVEPVEPVVPTAKAAEEQALHDEMEELAKVFQEELDRAKAEAKEVAEAAPVDPEIELSTGEIPPATEKSSSANEPIPEDELCDCCGEKRRGTAENPNSPYCADCDSGLRHYPFDFLNIFFAIVAICFVFYGGYVFADHTEAFVAVQKADSLRAEKKMYSALDAYASAANTMVNNHINGELVYKREILLAADLGYVSGLTEPASNIHSWEMSLPHFRSLKKVLDTSADIMATAEAAGSLLSAYETTAPQDIPYDDIIAQLDELKTTPVSSAQTDEDTTEETTASADAYSPKAKQYHSAMLAFYKYYVALLSGKDLDTQIVFLEEIRDTAPDMVWLYAPLLSELYAKTGRDIEPMCKLMSDFNIEDNSPALARVIEKRVAGQYEEATALCDEALAASEDLSSEFYRQKALMLLAQGNYSEAYTTVDTAYQSSSPSVQTVYTVALCAAAAGEETAYNEIIDMLESYGYTIPEEVTGYKDGSVTLDQILFEGDYDIS
ncbi:MAG: tetratricopeptide repeat protein [Candidatus Fimenecus sp.]